MRYGIPKAVYVDLKNVYIAPQAESVFQQACKKLGIEVIKAYSPQAKGRVERHHAIYQDRLVKEIKLSRLTSIEAANKLLENGFVDDLNKRFAKAPAKAESGHAPLGDPNCLDDILCWESTRVLQNDWTLSYQGACYQIEKGGASIRPKTRILVRQHLDGSLSFHDRDNLLTYNKVIRQPKALIKPSKKRQLSSHKPARNHPWKDPIKARQVQIQKVQELIQAM